MVAIPNALGQVRSSVLKSVCLALVISVLGLLVIRSRETIYDIPFVKDLTRPHDKTPPAESHAHSESTPHNASQPKHPQESQNVPEKESDDPKVIALVFYGRKEFVTILDCYLKRNLKINGGVLDEVVFSVNTGSQDDLEYLDELVKTSPKYRKHVAQKKYGPGTWGGSWEPVEKENIYIKIDDDVIFFEDGTIESMVRRMKENPHYFAVSANVINNPALSWVHYSMGVYEAYLPEMKPPKDTPAPSWRASQLPYWEGPDEFVFDGNQKAPYPGHRWLPVKGYYDITKTPAKDLSFDAFGGGLRSWAAAAQTHYSFLSHLEKDETYKYKFDVWDYHYQRISINFFGVWGKDIIEAQPFPGDDEAYLTTQRPKDLGRHVVVDGQSMAVHFAFGPQRDAHSRHGLFETDLLARYKVYADEMICPYPYRAETTPTWNQTRQ